jgi:hypothetical protein
MKTDVKNYILKLQGPTQYKIPLAAASAACSGPIDFSKSGNKEIK